jgi:hypothetical protein
MGRPYDSQTRYDDPSFTYDGAYIGPVGGDPDEIDDCYELAPNGFAVQVERAAQPFDSGEPYDSDVAYDGDAVAFVALLDTADDEFWSAAAVATTHTLRYRANAVTLRTGDQLQIGLDAYTVAHVPRRINASEMRAPLTLNPA